MRSIPIISGALLAAGLVLCVPRNAEAATIDQSLMYNGTTDWNHTFTFSQFDPTLGTLLSVSVTSIESMNTSGTLTNTSAGPQTFDYDETFQARVTPVGGSMMTSSNMLSTVTYTALAPNTPAAYGPAGGTGNLASWTSTDPGVLALYTGIGTVDFLGTTKTFQSFAGGGGNIKTDLTTTASNTVTVRYNYDIVPTPEPFSMALCGAGLVGVGILGRKRISRAK